MAITVLVDGQLVMKEMERFCDFNFIKHGELTT